MNIRWNMAELYYEAAEYNQAAQRFRRSSSITRTIILFRARLSYG